MYKKVSFALLVLTLILTACAPAAKSIRSATTNPSTMESLQGTTIQAPVPEAPAANSGAKSAYALDQTAASIDRLVIKNATLSMAVNDPMKSKDTITAMTETMGGFVVSADVTQQTLSNGVKVPLVSMTVRIPADKLDQALATIKKETDQPIISENETSQDVTAEYTDLNSRLTNLQAAEKQLQEIMGNAVKTEDVLAVYSQLVSVREQIELIKGQMKYYEQSAALSSVSVQLIANAAVQPITIAGWQPTGVAKEALQSLIHTLQSLADFGIRLVILYVPTLLVIFVPIGLVVWGLVALVRRHRKPKVASSPAP
jgi:hypothetical protein